ncbi:MAG: BTAD domain-containing putative transcriptional regulator, partial [Actinomycetes bacterium]
MRLRKVLGAGAIETTPQGYRLALPPDEVDSHRFERLLGRGRELLALAEPERAAFVLSEAMQLWRGPALTELDGWAGGRIESARLDELRRDAEELGVDAALRAGRAREVLGQAQRLVGEAPLRERRWALLALAQYQAGQQVQALRTLRQVRTVLATELALDPGP